MVRMHSLAFAVVAGATLGVTPLAAAQMDIEDEAYEREYEGEMEEMEEYERGTEPPPPMEDDFARAGQPDYSGQALSPVGITQATPGMVVVPFGIAVLGGAGVTGFADSDVYGFTEPGVQWDLRLIFGSRFVVSGEIAYVGSAQNVEALGLDPDAYLLSNGVEGLARLNILPGMIQPYIFAGIGWRYFDVVNADFNTSSLLQDDNVGFVPVGGGLTLRISNLLFDARGTFRPAFDSDLFGEEGEMHTWGASIRGGFEF